MKLVFNILFLIWINIGFGTDLSPCQDSLSDKTSEQIKDKDDFFNTIGESSTNSDSNELPPFLNISQMPSDFDSLTKIHYLEAYQEYYQYRTKGFQHRQDVFKWLLISSKLIFVLVIVLVMMGIVFSGLQFKKGSNDSKTELEFSKAGIKVTSSVLGVIVLIISLLFFYLYLVYVYPIQEIF